jgi:hypothetical protein
MHHEISLDLSNKIFLCGTCKPLPILEDPPVIKDHPILKDPFEQIS